MALSSDPNEAYRQTQFQIYNLQQTLLNSSKAAENKVNVQQQLLETNAYEAGKLAPYPNHGENIGITAAAHTTTKVNSQPVLDLVRRKLGKPHRHLGRLRYDPWKVGRLESTTPENPQDSNFPSAVINTELLSPPPFLPAFGFANINALVTVDVRFEDLVNAQKSQLSSTNLRINNNELWGSQLYTDDSDPILALLHSAVFTSSDVDGQNILQELRTPANLENPQNVKGEIPPANTPYDVKIDLLLLPPLQYYGSTVNGNIRSRSWNTSHDGISYGIYAIEVNPRDQSLQGVEPKDEIKAVNW
ncbi:LAFA_0G11782g1_1 [Lachancea sp. 'fantastica']|nr:LAFA_0G11782g1_1 [Lachancea sp. 'fantastica']